ncbi:MAG: class I lanthipeptide [Phycisphaerae bacterium]|nr:class I lanthipeptide [Phycisphaerae bacterium]
MKKNIKKLALNRETIRSLQDSELTLVAGGQGGLPPAVEVRSHPRPITGGDHYRCAVSERCPMTH